MAIPWNVYSRSGYAFSTTQCFNKNLSHAKFCYPATHRDGVPRVWLYRNHRHDLFQLPNPRSKPLWNAKDERFTDGSTSVRGEKVEKIHSNLQSLLKEAQSLPPVTSAQKTELITFTWVLEHVTGKILTVYTDSQYAYTILHTQGAIWKERRHGYCKWNMV